jgi:signal transduction histidine kinase
VKGLLKQRALLIGMLAVTVPLAFILYHQYRTLRSLERMLPVYRKERMYDYLHSVAADLEKFYRENADRVLGMPGSSVTDRVGGAIVRDPDGSKTIAATVKVADHFSNNKFEGARRLFLFVDTEYQGQDRPTVLFFDEKKKTLAPDPTAPDLRAINVTCAPYLIYIRSGAELDPRAMGSDRDPRFPLIVKPLLDEQWRIVGVAGMVVDEKYFTEKLLPETVQSHLREFFPEDYQDVVVAVSDETGDAVWGNEQIASSDAEARTRFGLIFQRWSLSNRMRHETEEQWARRFFISNVAIWGLLALMLLGGLTLTVRAASRAMRLSEMKSDFVSNVSHELRTPLASIRVFGEFFKLGRVKDNEKVREYGEYIETESRRLTGLINNILDFSKIESGQKAYKFELTDLASIISDTLKTFEVRLKQGDFHIRFESSRVEIPPVRVDADAMTQALVNLLDNAVKYSGESREIVVKLARKDRWATISVIDRGHGIPPAEHEKIFERFHRVGTGLVHEVRGSGLGLAIVKHIVDAHRGKVTVESDLGRGSVFTIHLPIEPGTVARPETRSQTSPVGGSTSLAH